MNAVERIDEYLNLKEEAPPIMEGNRPPENWPTGGEIIVKNLTLTYERTGPPILSDISFEVHAGEKVGIVGRTGAGKTTLCLAFFRFMEYDGGTIIIDGVDISRIGLCDLRQNLTIIPQEPVLFSGTLRSNLDPFSEYLDCQILDRFF